MTSTREIAEQIAQELKDKQMLDSEFLNMSANPIGVVASVVESALNTERERCATRNDLEQKILDASVAVREAEHALWCDREVGRDTQDAARELKAAQVRWFTASETLRLKRKALIRKEE